MKRLDLKLFIPASIIAFLGLLTLLSFDIGTNFLSIENVFLKQVIFVFLGIVIFFITTKIDISLLKYRPIVIVVYILTIFLLLLTLFLGQEVNGARRWLSMFSIQIQPSEIAKLTVVFVTGYIFTYKDKYNEWILAVVSLILLFPIFILVYLEPHGSMTGILLILWAVTSFVSMSKPFRNILLLLVFLTVFLGLFMFTAFGSSFYLLITLAGLVVAVFVYFSKDRWRIPLILAIIFSSTLGGVGSLIWNNFLSDYQRDRITAFQDPTANSKTTAFNVEQSKIAIGSGGLLGKGFAKGSQTRLKILPFHQTDFIFASYAEEFGLIGSLFLFALYIYIFLQIYFFSLRNTSYFFEISLLLVISIKILLEIFINLGTNLGAIPATGIPLPLMSAGGTITVMTFFSLGLIQCIITGIKDRELYKPKG